MKFNSPRIIFTYWAKRNIVSLYVFFAKSFNTHFTTFSLVFLPHSHFACLFCCHIYDPFFLSLLQNSMVCFLEERKEKGSRGGSAPSFLPSPQDAIQSTEAESHPLWITMLFTHTALFAEICTFHSNIYLFRAAAGIRHVWDNLRRSPVSGRLRTGDWSKPQNYNLPQTLNGLIHPWHAIKVQNNLASKIISPLRLFLVFLFTSKDAGQPPSYHLS